MNTVLIVLGLILAAAVIAWWLMFWRDDETDSTKANSDHEKQWRDE